MDASDKFKTQPGYNTHGTVSSTGVCSGSDLYICQVADVINPAHPCTSANSDTDGIGGLVIPNPANADERGHRCVCSYDVDDAGLYSETCVLVTVDGELDNEACELAVVGCPFHARFLTCACACLRRRRHPALRLLQPLRRATAQRPNNNRVPPQPAPLHL